MLNSSYSSTLLKEAKKSKKKSLGDLGHESYQQLSTYVPGMDLPFILGLTMQKKYPVSNDSDFMDLFPPRGAYRYGYRLRKILDHYSKSGDAEIAKKNLLSESLGSYTAVASAGIVALGIAKLLGKDPSWKHFSKGALIGSGIALGGWLLGESKPTQRSIPAQQDYDNKAKFLSWLIPGFASYNRTRRLGAYSTKSPLVDPPKPGVYVIGRNVWQSAPFGAMLPGKHQFVVAIPENPSKVDNTIKLKDGTDVILLGAYNRKGVLKGQYNSKKDLAATNVAFGLEDDVIRAKPQLKNLSSQIPKGDLDKRINSLNKNMRAYREYSYDAPVGYSPFIEGRTDKDLEESRESNCNSWVNGLLSSSGFDLRSTKIFRHGSLMNTPGVSQNISKIFRRKPITLESAF